VNEADFTFSTQSTTRLNAESEQVIKGQGNTEIGRMVDTGARDTTTASSKSANGKQTLMQVCTMMTKPQSQNVPEGRAGIQDHLQVASQEVESLREYDFVEQLAKNCFLSVEMEQAAGYETEVPRQSVRVMEIRI
jgi:hypothetical protein